METRRISWRISRADMATVGKIVERADALWKSFGSSPVPDLSMDLVACHANGCPMDFARLLAADDFNFAHDIAGIHRHLDRTTGRLADCFVPRCARPKQTRASVRKRAFRKPTPAPAERGAR